jgi:hypothetical protein
MKNKFLTILALIVFFVIEDYGFYLLKTHLGTKTIFNVLDFLSKSLLLFILFETILYKRFFNFHSNRFRLGLSILIPLIVAMHLADRLNQIEHYYFHSKKTTKNISSNLWRFDKYLGHKAIPNAVGTYNYYIGDSIKGSSPIRFDTQGFRIPESVVSTAEKQAWDRDLFLGCSFTFGDYVLAENTYPFLTAEKLHHTCLNAGASAYGFGQMIQIADSLIPKQKFHYVFIQLSPWLSERAMNINGPTFYGYRPFPFFSDKDKGFQLNPPVYSTLMYANRIWRQTPQSYLEKWHFTLTDGLKIEIVDYYAFKMAQIKMKLGLVPKPTLQKRALELFFYDYVIDLCLKNGAVPILLKVRYPEQEGAALIQHLSQKAKIIDLDSPLAEKQVTKHLSFDQLFAIYHVQNRDSILFDNHPNPYAHQLFAEKIGQTLLEKGISSPK